MKKTLEAEFSGMSVAALGFIIFAPFADNTWSALIVGIAFLLLDFRVHVKKP